jgi:nucleoside-diphosphate-sugar epimerase
MKGQTSSIRLKELLMAQRALVVGGNGGFGLAVAEALKKRGWHIAGLFRDPAKAKAPRVFDEALKGDALDRSSVKKAALGRDLLIHAVNPPYERWATDAMPMLEATIAAAKASGATILFPGNIYNYGPDAGLVLHEGSPQNPVTRKGKIRVAMENALKQAADEGMRVVVLRCGDFYGADHGSNWLESGILGGKPGIPTALRYPDDPRIGHSWAYLPDVGEAAAKLVLAPLRSGFYVFGFAGHFLEPGQHMLDAVQATLPTPLPVKTMPWAFLRVVGLFLPMVRELFEMRYLWQQAHRIDDTLLRSMIGAPPTTDLQAAVAAALAPRLNPQQ